MPKPKFTHAQRMQRLEVARKFKTDERMELLEKAAKDPAFSPTLTPTQKLNLAHYLKSRAVAAEVEEDLRRMGNSYFDLNK